MSSFSSVVRKPGTAIKPKAPLRRNVQRKIVPASSPTPDQESLTTESDAINATEVQPAREVEISHGTTPSSLPVAQLSDQNDGASTAPVRPTASPSVPAVRVTKQTDDRTATPVLVASVEDVNTEVAEEQGSVEENTIVQDEQVAGSSRGQKRKMLHMVDDGQNAVDAGLFDVPAEPVQTSMTEISEDPAVNTNEGAALSVSPQSSRRRRKNTPRAAPNLVLSQTRSTISPFVRRDTSPQLSRRSDSYDYGQPSVDLLQSATNRAASVSELANSIDSAIRTQRLHQNSETPANGPPDPTVQDDESHTDPTSVPKRGGRKKRKTAAERAAEVIAHIGQHGKAQPRKRAVTPEDAANHKIEPDQVTMGELVRDRKLGKKSQLEEEMERDWDQIVERRKEARERALEAAQSRRRKPYGSNNIATAPVVSVAALMPGLTVVNGQIVSDLDSRQVDRAAILEQTAIQDATAGVREDKPYFRRINQTTVGMKASSMRKFRWDDDSTAKFYKGLQMFGTDFLMIANMFPGLDRKQLKMKFIREENADKAKVKEFLANRIPIDLEEYSKVTNTEFQDPQEVQAELDAEEKRLRDEDNERRVREGFVSANAGDRPLPSAEGETIPNNQTDPEGQPRFAEMAQEIMAPRKRQRQPTSSKKRGTKSGRGVVEGVEEALGAVDEVPI